MLHMLHMLILFFPARQRQRHKLRNNKDFRKVANPTHNPEVGAVHIYSNAEGITLQLRKETLVSRESR